VSSDDAAGVSAIGFDAARQASEPSQPLLIARVRTRPFARDLIEFRRINTTAGTCETGEGQPDAPLPDYRERAKTGGD